LLHLHMVLKQNGRQDQPKPQELESEQAGESGRQIALTG
jgi:hypothetical protein